MAEFQRGAAVRAAQRAEPDPALIIAKNDQVFAQQATAKRPAFELGAEADGMPIAAHHFAARRARSDMSDQFVFFNAESHWQSPESAIIGIWRRYIRERTTVSNCAARKISHCLRNDNDRSWSVIPACFSGNLGELRLLLEKPFGAPRSTRLHSKFTDILPDSLAL